MYSVDFDADVNVVDPYSRCGRIAPICQLGPRYEGQLTQMAEPIPPSGQSSSYSLTTLSSSSSTDRRAETDRKVITTRIAVAHHFRCRLRRRESCILGATSSQPTLLLHELPPARLVIHRQTSAHERRKGTRSPAYIAHLTASGSCLIRSLMKIRKRVGDRTPPCGTPCRRRFFLLLALSMVSLALRLCRYDLIHLYMFPPILPFLSLRSNPSVHTLSNAF